MKKKKSVKKTLVKLEKDRDELEGELKLSAKSPRIFRSKVDHLNDRIAGLKDVLKRK